MSEVVNVVQLHTDCKNRVIRWTGVYSVHATHLPDIKSYILVVLICSVESDKPDAISFIDVLPSSKLLNVLSIASFASSLALMRLSVLWIQLYIPSKVLPIAQDATADIPKMKL